MTIQNLQVAKGIDLSSKTGKVALPCRINISLEKPSDLSLVLSNDNGEELIVGYDKSKNQYFIDRIKSGNVNFQKDFAGRHVAPRVAENNKMDLSLIIDVSSVELFADGGLSVMTEIFFPAKPYNKIDIQSSDGALIKRLEYSNLSSIWK